MRNPRVKSSEIGADPLAGEVETLGLDEQGRRKC
jgi:hypothetical protein